MPKFQSFKSPEFHQGLKDSEIQFMFFIDIDPISNLLGGPSGVVSHHLSKQIKNIEFRNFELGFFLNCLKSFGVSKDKNPPTSPERRAC